MIPIESALHRHPNSLRKRRNTNTTIIINTGQGE